MTRPTLAFYNQSSLKRHFQPHGPQVLVLTSQGGSPCSVCGQAGIVSSVGWGCGRRDNFSPCCAEGPSPSRKEMCSGRSSRFRSCFPWSLEACWYFNTPFCELFEGKLVVDDLPSGGRWQPRLSGGGHSAQAVRIVVHAVARQCHVDSQPSEDPCLQPV